MKRIPKAFKLAGHRFTVKTIDEETMLRLTGGKAAYGLFVPDDLAIYLLPATRKLKRSIVLQTFYHELFHAVFWVANHKWMDEKLVDQCGHLIHQVMTTSEF